VIYFSFINLGILFLEISQLPTGKILESIAWHTSTYSCVSIFRKAVGSETCLGSEPLGLASGFGHLSYNHMIEVVTIFCNIRPVDR
jgi:hypothetical protein